MTINLPPKKDSQTISTVNNNTIIIGANGSGKTRFGYKIESKYSDKTHRISAQKSLTMPENVSPTSKESAEKDFLYGYDKGNLHNKEGFRWGSNPNTFLLNDYQKLMVLLHTEEYDESIKFKGDYIPGQNNEKPITKLDVIKKVWETVLPPRKLVIKLEL